MISKKIFQLISVCASLLLIFACGNNEEGKSESEKPDVHPIPSSFDNPIIKYDTENPTNEAGDIIYTADPAVMVEGDTVYLYATHDEQAIGTNDYRMYDYRLRTSTDMVTWENKGAVLRYSDFE